MVGLMKPYLFLYTLPNTPYVCSSGYQKVYGRTEVCIKGTSA